MNRKRIIGVVKYFNVFEGNTNGRDWCKINWTLETMNGRQYNNIPCSSFDKRFAEVIKDGMEIELTSYLPLNRSYKKVNQETGMEEKKTFFTIEVEDFKILSDSETNSASNMDFMKKPSENQKEDDVEDYYQAEMSSYQNFDVNKAYESSVNAKVDDEEEMVSLDWMEDLNSKKGKEKLEAELKKMDNENMHSTDLNIVNKINEEYRKKIPSHSEFEVNEKGEIIGGDSNEW